MTASVDSHQNVLKTTNSNCLLKDGAMQELNSLEVVVGQHLPPFRPFQGFLREGPQFLSVANNRVLSFIG